MKNVNYLILLLLSLNSFQVFGNCTQFESALQVMTARVAAHEEVKSAKEIWSAPEVQSYVDQYGKNTNGGQNRYFMSLNEADKAEHAKDVVYFSTENSIQKLLNDKIIARKDVVDAINNSYLQKLNENLKDFPELSALMRGKNTGFKNQDIRLRLSSRDNRELIESQLSELYRKSNAQFLEEFEKRGLAKLLPEGVDPSTFFLAGVGGSAIEANQAARWARIFKFKNGNARAVNFKEIIDTVHAEIKNLEGLRSGLAVNKALLDAKIMNKLDSGEVIPSRDMIDILRKVKLSDCKDQAEYYAKFRARVKTQFNTDIKTNEIDDLTAYFQKVDSLSPPIYERERVLINLGDAKDDIISVDFTGIGVDNAEAQMMALAKVNFNQADKGKLLDDAYDRIQEAVDNVTFDMNLAKRWFSVAATNGDEKKPKPKFSGDDGIHMPEEAWDMARKIDLVKFLSKFKDPSKFRLTTGKTTYKGKAVPVSDRSATIGRAEKIEKDLREDVTGALKIPSADAKRMLFGIDYKDGKYNLILGGQKPTPAERAMIVESFKKSLKTKDGESMGQVIEAFN